MKILAVRELDTPLLDGINALLPQLTSTVSPLTASQLERIVTSTCSRLYVAMDGEFVLGMLTLVLVPIPTGLRAWIEDVVVAASARGKGIGRRMLQKALDHAASQGADNVNLTAHPSRTAAQGLYRRMGFSIRDTDVFRYVP